VNQKYSIKILKTAIRGTILQNLKNYRAKKDELSDYDEGKSDSSQNNKKF
jgi:hypothetical protein